MFMYFVFPYITMNKEYATEISLITAKIKDVKERKCFCEKAFFLAYLVYFFDHI